MRTISVSPLGESAWTVRCDAVDGDMVFRSGARAESAARRLGERLAASGESCEVRIHDRRSVLVGSVFCAPPEADPATLGDAVFAVTQPQQRSSPGSAPQT